MFESLKVVLINMVTILVMSAIFATLIFLKIKFFEIKIIGVIIFVHEVINKILSLDPSYIIDVAM